MAPTEILQDLGWRGFLAAQVDGQPGDACRAARIVAVHRDRVELAGDGVPASVQTARTSARMDLTVGDWVIVDTDAGRITSRLERFCVFRRRTPGDAGSVQYIAANVDTVFIVTSANRDFNVARLERYLALAREAGAFPVVVITKSDLVDDAGTFARDAARLAPGLLVESLDARDPAAVDVLRPWCGPGQTVALMGSSGVGKSTLVNSLCGADLATRPVRQDDQRGRHATTGRSMHRLPAGGWLIDTPGMRELGLTGLGDALDDVFTDVAGLARRCRFADCTHDREPGCAVLAAIERGELDGGRLARYRKLVAEERRNSETLAERRSRDRSLGRMYKAVQAGNRKQKGEEL